MGKGSMVGARIEPALGATQKIGLDESSPYDAASMNYDVASMNSDKNVPQRPYFLFARAA